MQLSMNATGNCKEYQRAIEMHTLLLLISFVKNKVKYGKLQGIWKAKVR